MKNSNQEIVTSQHEASILLLIEESVKSPQDGTTSQQALSDLYLKIASKFLELTDDISFSNDLKDNLADIEQSIAEFSYQFESDIQIARLQKMI